MKYAGNSARPPPWLLRKTKPARIIPAMSEPAAKRPVGRPTNYRPEYCEQVIACLSDGHSITGFAGKIGVARSTVVKWQAEIPEFSAAVKVGQAGAVSWWEERAKAIANGEPGNVVATIFGLKNRAADDWRDKTEVTHNVDEALADVLANARKRRSPPD